MPKPLISKSRQKEIALERVRILFREAEEVFPKSRSLASRYVALAKKIAMKVRLRFPPELKRRYCKHCHSLLKPGINARIRVRDGKVIISCLECRKISRIPVR